MALIEGVKYGLSSYQNSSAPPTGSSNKTVLFVKLTDSAIRAIEEYLRIQQKTGQNATLQFLGNEGRINIPTSHSSSQGHFDFSLQSNADIEGPSGSFECIKQSSSRSLESMGTLPFKMRIKANDDVYEETRQRFIQFEDIRKQECAKEIKPNGPDGRKVKKKMDRIPAPMGRRDTSPFSHSKFSPNNSNAKSTTSSPFGQTSSSTNRNFSGFPSVGNTSSNNGTARPPSTCKPGIGPSDIAKRPLKERLIHLLAIKPFKKPEMQARLQRDSIKDREKQLVMTILKQISVFKNNEYVLLRGVWNDVQEDWPCYTEQERQLMKRRKPQNLTPPGSDSSVSSGVSGCSGLSLSPRSTASTSSGGHSSPSHHQNGQYSNNSHFGTKSASGSSSRYGSNGQNVPGTGTKRPLSSDPLLVGPDGILLEDISGYEDVPNSKKPRVSHFKRPVRSGGSSSNSQQGLSVNSLVGGSDRDGLSPHLHQNRVADRLSPIGSINGHFNGSSNHPINANGLSHSFGNTRSPNNVGEQLVGGSPSSYFNSEINSHPSPQDEFHTGDENMGGFSPYKWNSNSNDPQGVQAMDSDETDSIDSGNGSSTSTSGRRYNTNNDDIGFGGGLSAFHAAGSLTTSSAKIATTNNNRLEVDNSGHGPVGFSGVNASCNRVSSTTSGSGSGYNLSPQSSPESHVNDSLQKLQIVPNQQKQQEGCEVKIVQGLKEPLVTPIINGGGYIDNPIGGGGVAGESSRQVVRDGYCERRSDKDKERASRGGGDKESRHNRDKDRSDGSRRDRGDDRKPAQTKKGSEIPTRKSKAEDNNDTLTKAAAVVEHPPSYLTQYTPIETVEQRIRYKDDFNTDYPSYRDLHTVIEKVSKKFAQLEERLRDEVRGSPEYQRVRDQIVKEYYACKKDRRYQEAKEKFNHLHKKLAYIKELVAEYDRHNNNSFGPESSPTR